MTTSQHVVLLSCVQFLVTVAFLSFHCFRYNQRAVKNHVEADEGEPKQQYRFPFLHPRRGVAGVHNSTGQQKINVALLSDRLLPSAVTLGTVCKSSGKKPSDIIFHVITENVQDFRIYFDHIQDCRGAHLELLSIDDATSSLQDQGFSPFWAYHEDINNAQIGDWGIATPYTDEKHSHPLNLLRFYLPYLPKLSEVEKFVFLDDDVVVREDISSLFDLEPDSGKAMLAGCQHWIWNASTPGGYQTSYNLTLKTTGYIGNTYETCTENLDEDPFGCTRAGLEEEIASVAKRLHGPSEFSSHPLDRKAFNMGFNLIQVSNWKSLQITHNFERWVDASRRKRLFPENTLAFGLGLGCLAIGDAFGCYDDEVGHLVGLSFVTQQSLDVAGWSIDKIRSGSFALHFNGPKKPWIEDIEETCSIYRSDSLPKSATEIWQHACIDATLCSCEAKNGIGNASAEMKGQTKERNLGKDGNQNSIANEYAPKGKGKGKGQGALGGVVGQQTKGGKGTENSRSRRRTTSQTDTREVSSYSQMRTSEWDSLAPGKDVGNQKLKVSLPPYLFCEGQITEANRCNMFPTIYIIGSGRCGTTSLHNIFALHPDIMEGKALDGERSWTAKEIEFWSNGSRFPNQEWYINHFPLGKTPIGSNDVYYKRAIDSTPSYASVAIVPERMRQATPDEIQPYMRFIEVVRNPVDRFLSYFCQIIESDYWSQWVPFLTDGLGLRRDKDSMTLLVSKALDAIQSCIVEHPEAATDQLGFEACVYNKNAIFKIISDGLYLRQIEWWTTKFDPSHFMLLGTQSLRGDDRDHLLSVAESILAFTGLRRDEEWLAEIVRRPQQRNGRKVESCNRNTLPSAAIEELSKFYGPFNTAFANWAEMNQANLGALDENLISYIRTWEIERKVASY